MRIVLREHVEHLGERGEVVNVAPGYARNYLLPKRLALEATPGNLKVVEHQKKLWTVKENQEIGEAEQLAARLAELDLKVVKKAGESGTLYGSVTNVEIAELLGTKGVEIDRRRIVLEDPIKAVGRYDISIKLHHRVIGRIQLLVDAEETASPAS